jgi:hypothetical protein
MCPTLVQGEMCGIELFGSSQGAKYLMENTLKVVWVEFSTYVRP